MQIGATHYCVNKRLANGPDNHTLKLSTMHPVPELQKRGARWRTRRFAPLMTFVKCVGTRPLNTPQLPSESAEPFLDYNLAHNLDVFT